jgi:hypothetical protein
MVTTGQGPVAHVGAKVKSFRIVLTELQMNPFTKSRSHRCKHRSGAAVVELAIILPLLMLLVFGTVQSCNAIHLRQALVTAAFEGSRVVTRDSASREDVIARCNSILDARGVTGYTITITPNQPLHTIDDGENVSVRIEAPIAGNVIGPNILQFSGNLSVVSFSAR